MLLELASSGCNVLSMTLACVELFLQRQDGVRSLQVEMLQAREAYQEASTRHQVLSCGSDA